MAYAPSLADIPQESYSPSLQDVMEVEKTHQENPYLSAVGRVSGDILAGVANAGQGLANAPANLINYLRNQSPMLAKYVPQQGIQDINPSQVYGINNQNLGDKLLQGAAQYAPYAIGGGALAAEKGLASAAPWATNMINQGRIGMAFGGTQSKDPIQGATLGGTINAGLSGIGSAASAVPGAIKDYLSKFAAQGLTKNVSNIMDTAKSSTNQAAFDMAKENYGNYSQREENAWNNLSNEAKKADAFTQSAQKAQSSDIANVKNRNIVNSTGSDLVSQKYVPNQTTLPPGTGLSNNVIGSDVSPRVYGTKYFPGEPQFIPGEKPLPNDAKNIEGQTVEGSYKQAFDNSDYIKSLNGQLSFLKNQSERQSGFDRANKQSINLIQDYVNDQHGTFSDAIEHNRALNKDYQNEIAPGQPLPFKTVNFAKSKLKDTIENNIEKQGLDDTLGVSWDLANGVTSDKNRIFNNVVNNGGREQISKFSGFLNGKSEYQDPTTFVKDYVPTSRGDGTQKMEQFSKMIGDENSSKNILKMNYFENAYKNDSLNGKTFLDKYNNLSKDQQNYLFNSDENRTIQALNKIAQEHPDMIGNSHSSGILTHSIPGLLGIGMGYLTGIGEIGGGMAGLLGGKLASKGLGKLFENPKISNYFVNNLLGLNKNKIMSNSTQQILPGLTLPQTGGLAASQPLLQEYK